MSTDTETEDTNLSALDANIKERGKDYYIYL